SNLTIHTIDSWYKQEKFLQYWTEKIDDAFNSMTAEEKETACLIVCAHSLPEKIIAMGDPYRDQLFETKELLQQRTGVKNVEFGWQSAGQTNDPWLGPDVQDLTRDLFNEKGYRSFVYTPVGFVAEHLEVLYDNDYECKVVCDEIGANYRRPKMPNADSLFIGALVDAVMTKLAKV
ncbi:MAG: ferrochelatase, partial [Kurthia sp.]